MGEIFEDRNESAAAKASARPNPAPQVDLSTQIEQAVKREPADIVRCVRVFGDFYRCNWWSRLGKRPATRDYDWGGLMTDCVRQSRFFKATLSGDQVVMTESELE